MGGVGTVEELGALRDAIEHAGISVKVVASTPGQTVGGVVPAAIVRPADMDALVGLVSIARRMGLGLIARGSGSQDGWGGPIRLPAVVVDLQAFRGIISYQPGDLTVRVRAGTPVGFLNTSLAAHGQTLALPTFGSATVGGCVVGDRGGFRGSGGIRDLVLGLSLVDGAGRAFKTGGNVVKNVSGLDIGKLLIGSFGTLGFVTEVACRVRPVPARTAISAARWPDRVQALAAMRLVEDAGLLPAAAAMVQEDGWCATLLQWEGNAAEVEHQSTRVRELWSAGERVEDPVAGGRLRAAEAADVQRGGVRVRCQVDGDALSVAWRGEALAGRPQAVVWPLAATLFWSWPDLDDTMEAVTVLRSAVQQAEEVGGLVTVIDAPKGVVQAAEISPWGNPGPLAGLYRRMKSAFDPDGILSPGRFIGEG